MKKYFFLFFIISCFHFSIASPNGSRFQNISLNKTTNANPLKKLIKQLAKANVFDATPLRVSNKVVSEQESLYKELINLATPDQLTEMATSNKNGVVRLYAFRALMEKVKDAPGNVLQQFMNDTTLIRVINGSSSEMKPMNSISNGFLY